MILEFIKTVTSCTLTFIALINPIQKIFVITSLQHQFDVKTLRHISFKSTFTAFLVLLAFLWIGQLVFNYVFHIELYAFQITCGVVLFYNGITGLQKGAFLKLDKNLSIKDISAVPIAIPMIAGPATITAAVTFPVHFGHIATTLAIIIALVVNYVSMFYARSVGNVLNKYNLMNPLVRIFGLIVASIGLQMILNGVKGFIATI